MARTALTVSALANLAASAAPADLAGTAINAGSSNGHTLATGGSGDRVMLFIDASTGGLITVKAGAEPPAMRAGAGDYAFTAPTGQSWLGPFESGRFLQADGTTINIDVAASTAGTIYAALLPSAT